MTGPAAPARGEQPTPSTIAVIGAGAMGSAVAARLVAAGFDVVTSLMDRTAATRERARTAGVREVAQREIANAAMLLAIVPPAAAANVLDRWLPILAAERSACLYVDCNALAPASKIMLAGRARSMGTEFVDAALIGPPPMAGAGTTCLYLSGGAASRLAGVAVPGLDVRLVGNEIGAAAALKMCFAAVNKGVTGLVTAALLAAEENGAAAPLAAVLAERLPWVADRVGSSIPAMYPKAARWVAEMEEIASFLGGGTPAGDLFTAMARFYAERANGDQADELSRLRRLSAP